MHQRGGPDERINEAMPLVDHGAAFVVAVISVIRPDAGAAGEHGIGAASLAIVDRMSPGIGSERLESVRESLLEGHRQGVVPTADAVGGFINTGVFRTGARIQIYRGRKRADLIRASRVVDL